MTDLIPLSLAARSVIKYTIDDTVFRWNVTTLWIAAKQYTKCELPVSLFADELAKDRWFQNYTQPTVANVIRHCVRMLEADLRYPIILSPDLRVLDGLHRLAKAAVNGLETVPTIRLLALPPSDYMDDDVFQAKEKAPSDPLPDS